MNDTPSAKTDAAEPEITDDFEAALAELESLVERMENGSLTLDASLAAFERGIHLTRTCQHALAHAEQRVRLLLERDDGSAELGEAPASLTADTKIAPENSAGEPV